MNGATHPDDESEDGQLVCWGCGEFGQHGHRHSRDVEYRDGIVAQFSQSCRGRVKLVACGASHTLVVTNSDEIFVWGNGNSGQLGCSQERTDTPPQRLTLNLTDSTVFHVISAACGSRHSMVCLENGNVFTFGNNSHGQLGFDYRKENCKENRITPYLLSFNAHRPVAQIACGDKHSVFLFQDGGLACVGNNAHGQIGSDRYDEALEPRDLQHEKTFKYIACGAYHNLAITVDGEVYVWGLGKACGSKSGDIKFPVQQLFHHSNFVQVSGGSIHCMALTDSGIVYTWGCGNNGQLGHGEKICFSSRPRKLKFSNASHRVVQISSREHICAAVTENGGLFMWGKSNHTISPEKTPLHKFFTPTCVNQNQLPVCSVACGSWHGVAITGIPDVHLQDDTFATDEDDRSSITESMASDDSEVFGMPDVQDINDCLPYQSDDTESELTALVTPDIEHGLKLQREKTKVSLGEFYAPTPDIADHSFDNFTGIERQMAPVETCVHDYPANRTVSRCSTRLVVQVPSSTEPQYVDVATSPIPISSSDTETSSTSVIAQELAFKDPSPSPTAVQDSIKVYSPVWTDTHQQSKSLTLFTKPKNLQDESVKFPHHFNFFRSKSCLVHNSSKVVQVSSTTAENFALPRENTFVSSKSIDFAEMEIARLVGAKKFPRRFLKTGKLADPSGSHDPSIPNINKPKTEETRSPVANGSVKTWSRSLGFDVSSKPVLIPTSRSDDANVLSDQVPLSSNMKIDKENLGLHITRSHTVIGPLRNSPKSTSTRIHHLQHYRNVHNPGTGNPQNTEIKIPPKSVTQRHVSIPGRRLPYLHYDADDLFIGGRTDIGPKITFPSANSWKNKSDLESINEKAGIKTSLASNTSSVSSKESNEFVTANCDDDISKNINSTKKQENDTELELKIVDDSVQSLTDIAKLPDLVNDHNSKQHVSHLNCVDTYDLSDILDTPRPAMFPEVNSPVLKVSNISRCRDHTKITRPIDKSDFAKKLISFGNSQSS